MTARVFLISVLSVILACCSRTAHPGLVAVEALSATAPDEALDSLRAIDYATLSDADKHYYDFLSVKVADKAYIEHTSDSLIHRVVDYESRHKGNGRYPEALYYAGRVHSDLGDYPLALRYFQQTLDIIENTNDLKLKNRVLSQTGRLLNSLRLYDRAIPYIQRAIQADSILRDSVNYMYDTQLLGAINLHAQYYDEAESHFKLARKLALNISAENVYLQDMYLAAIKYYKEDLDSALILIRPLIDKMNSIDRDNALAYAACIYLDCGIVDTAYIYANELVTNPNSYNKEIGYKILLSPQLKDFVSQDSLYPYITQNFSVIDDRLGQHSSQEALMQNAYYNYHTHEQKSLAAIKKTYILKQVIAIIVLLAFALISVILYLLYRNKSTILRLHEALLNIKALRAALAVDSDPKHQIAAESMNTTPIQDPNEQLLKKQLQEEVIALQDTCNTPRDVSQRILASEAYANLQSYVSAERVIVENNPLWGELDIVVSESSPNFKYHLRLLTGGKLKDSDYHIILLIKCGITPTQMTHLLGKAKGTISYRRQNMCLKLFDKKLGTKAFDSIIFTL